MPIFKVENDKFQALESVTLEDEKIYEVEHLQKWLSHSIEVLDEDLLVISTEFNQ